MHLPHSWTASVAGGWTPDPATRTSAERTGRVGCQGAPRLSGVIGASGMLYPRRSADAQAFCKNRCTALMHDRVLAGLAVELAGPASRWNAAATDSASSAPSGSTGWQRTVNPSAYAYQGSKGLVWHPVDWARQACPRDAAWYLLGQAAGCHIFRPMCQRAGIRRRGQGAARQGRRHRGREVLDAAAARRTMPPGGAKVNAS
jgi:hypothetical protein